MRVPSDRAGGSLRSTPARLRQAHTRLKFKLVVQEFLTLGALDLIYRYAILQLDGLEHA